MRTARLLALTLIGFGFVTKLFGQPDGDHPTTDPVTGITVLAPDANVNFGLTPPDGLTIGTIPSNAAALVVRTDQLPGLNVNAFDTYGTYDAVNSVERESRWRLFRSVDLTGGVREIGRISAASGTMASINSGFFIRQMQPDAALHLRNFSQNGIRLIDDVTTTVNGYTNMNLRHGYIGVGSNSAGTNMQNSGAPWARVHAFHQQGGGVQTGWRPHMDNGFLSTGNSDLSYFGQMYDMGATGLGTEIGDNSNALIGWGSSNITAATNAWDNCSFRFYSNPAGTNAGSSSTVRGLEIMRLRPYRATTTSAIEGFVGLGDWAAGADLPSERLHLLSGRVRVEDLADAGAQDDSQNQIVVVDNSAGTERGVLKWRNINSLTDCKWTLSTGTYPNVYTATGATSGCPGDVSNVGIGMVSPGAKFDVYRSATSTSPSTVGQFIIEGSRDLKQAIFAKSIGTGNSHYAINTRASGADGSFSKNIGVVGWAGDPTPDNTTENIGVFGQAIVGENASEGNVDYNVAVDAATAGSADSQVLSNYGVRSYAITDAVCTDNYGGYFNATASNVTNNYGGYFSASASGSASNWALYANGWGFTSSGTWVLSDASLKTNIQDVVPAEASAVLNAIPLHTFDFNQAACPQMHMPTGSHLGVLAHELEDILPALVRNAHQPAETSADADVVNPGVDFKAVNYEGLIPYLVAGYQAQQERITQLEEMVTACCAAGGGMAPQGPITGSGPGQAEQRMTDETIIGNARALLINPNPFVLQTTLTYTLDRAGRMQLLSNSADGKVIKVLSEAALEAGTYSYEWHTTDLSPGVYYVTLLLDGEPVVKKAVKVKQ